MGVLLICCPSNMHTCYRALESKTQPASEAQHCRCGLLESVYDRHRSSPRNLCRIHRHGQSRMEFFLGRSRGLRQCYRGLPDCFPERFPAQPQLEDLPQQRLGQWRPASCSKEYLEKSEPPSTKHQCWRYIDGHENDYRQIAAQFKGWWRVRLVVYCNAKPLFEPEFWSNRARRESSRPATSNDGLSCPTNDRSLSI